MPSKSKMEKKVTNFIDAKKEELAETVAQINKLQQRHDSLSDEIELLESLLVEDTTEEVQ